MVAWEYNPSETMVDDDFHGPSKRYLNKLEVHKLEMHKEPGGDTTRTADPNQKILHAIWYHVGQ